MSANDTLVSTEVTLNQVDTAYPNTAWGMNEMSTCCRGRMIDCTPWAICPTWGLFGPTSAKYWRVVSTLRTCISPSVMSISLMTEMTLVSIVAMARAQTESHRLGVMATVCAPVSIDGTTPAWLQYIKHGHLLLYNEVPVSKLVPSCSELHI